MRPRARLLYASESSTSGCLSLRRTKDSAREMYSMPFGVTSHSFKPMLSVALLASTWASLREKSSSERSRADSARADGFEHSVCMVPRRR